MFESGPMSAPQSTFWLLGDSFPSRYAGVFSDALDPRHPTRHNIWTPIADAMQRHVFEKRGLRIEDRSFHVTNAVERADDKPPSNLLDWTAWATVMDRVQAYGKQVAATRPKIIVTFGQFSYEFARRSKNIPILPARTQSDRPTKYWTRDKLGEEFERVTQLAKYSSALEYPILIPLLHATIARREFLKAHISCCQYGSEGINNYFDYAGKELAKLLLAHEHEFDVWMQPKQD